MNKQIIGSLVAVLMVAGAGCASQADSGSAQTGQERLEAAKLEGATDIRQLANAAGNVVCYRPARCAQNAEAYMCCIDLDTGDEQCGGRGFQYR